MKTILRILSCLFALGSLNTWAQQSTADWFEFPVGGATAAPVEMSNGTNGFHISQHFDTSANYETTVSPFNDTNGAWCSDASFVPQSFTSKASCNAATYVWRFGHSGNDLSNSGTGGENVRATSHGVVVYARTGYGYGNMLILRHILPGGAKVYSLYAHLKNETGTNAPFLVALGAVSRDATIGHVGNTGGVPFHLHFAMFNESMFPGGMEPAPNASAGDFFPHRMRDFSLMYVTSSFLRR